MFYRKLKDDVVKCELCPNYCVLKEGEYGKCRARKNVFGRLQSMVYGLPLGFAIDPIEKKPLFHFLPGSKIFSIGTSGCTLHCDFCQNPVSQEYPEDVHPVGMSPNDIVERAIYEGCNSIAYTYNEPTTFYEYAYDIAKMARKKGLRNVMVTNGFINPEPTKELYQYIDAANVDLKAFTDKFYKKFCLGSLKPVLNTLKLLKKMNVWFEITNLLMEGLNDDPKDIKKMCEWIKKELGVNVPLFFTRFHPAYRMLDKQPTPVEKIVEAYEIAKKSGLKNVYTGNLKIDKYFQTYCPECKAVVVERNYFDVIKNNLNNGKCPKCNTKIEGVWE
ncbi:MAG: AmmeMemoRadiSam system radical SAM enzyme [Nanoarchaeota archaeon]|nr:AmmeMemoRadiSam system radical SAM enzyme [Nanoarchaeota archaeon]